MSDNRRFREVRVYSLWGRDERNPVTGKYVGPKKQDGEWRTYFVPTLKVAEEHAQATWAGTGNKAGCLPMVWERR